MQVVLFLPRGDTFSRNFDVIRCLFSHGSCPGSLTSKIIESAPCNQAITDPKKREHIMHLNILKAHDNGFVTESDRSKTRRQGENR
jgi:hypothetical protein